MKIHLLMAQRVENYPGEYGPEALGAATEYDFYENPNYLRDMKATYKDSGEFDAVEIVSLEVSEEDIENRMFPVRSPAKAKVV